MKVIIKNMDCQQVRVNPLPESTKQLITELAEQQIFNDPIVVNVLARLAQE